MGKKDKHVCTKEAPVADPRALHPDAVEVKQYEDWEYGQVYAVMACPHCALIFEVEVP